MSPAATEQSAEAKPESSLRPSAVSDAPGSKQSNRKKQATTPAGTMGMLPQIVKLAAKQDGGPYKALKQNGHMRPFIEYFPADEHISSAQLEEKRRQ